MDHGEPAGQAARVLIVGRSPSVLLAAVRLLRAQGHRADATNQFDRVLDDYDPAELDILVFGGMVPPETKQRLSEEVTRRNAGIRVVQGLAGIPGVIAAQVEAAVQDDPADRDSAADSGDVAYDRDGRTVRVALDTAAHVTVEALWGTSFTPPEPTSTSMPVFEGELAAGRHGIAVPDEVPDVASFAAVTIGTPARTRVRVLTLGAMPQSVARMVPTSAEDRRLPEVAAVTTHGDDL